VHMDLVTRHGQCSNFGDALWAAVANLVMRYGPLRQIWFSAMGHCGEFGDVLWATSANLAVRFGLLWQICFCAMGHREGFCALWAIVQEFVIRYGP
jgi:hypothetical protein